MTLLLSLSLVISAFFIPTSQLIRPEYFIVTFLGLLAVFKGRLILKTFKTEIVLFAFLFFFAILSILGQLFFAKKFSPNDLMILVRYFIYLTAILGGGVAFLNIKRTWTMWWLLILLMFISLLISFMQYFNLYEINNIMIPVYNARDELLISGMSWRRIIGTLSNPNYWGLWLSICLVSTAYYSVIKKQIFVFPILILLFLCIVMTGSRTALFSSLLGSFIGYILLSSDSSKQLSVKFFRLLFLCITSITLYFGYSIFASNYYSDTSRFDLNNTYTLELRFKHWFGFIEQTINDPYKILIGRGPSKSNEIIFGDNMYLLMLRDFGPFAMASYLLLWRTIFTKLYIQIKLFNTNFKNHLSIALMVAITFFIFDLAADGWFNVRLAIPLFFGYGFLIMKSNILYKR